MFKEIKVYQCDICGKLEEPWTYYEMGDAAVGRPTLPIGWSKLGNTNYDICDICSKALAELRDKYRAEKENNNGKM